ncbi:MAG: transposase [Candidatus Nomurabacteria bacterium]|nr:transposase [Candidatus Nomurabacteria bacterium]
MRKDPLLTSEYYHIYNRGVDKRDIFMNKDDLDRFVLSIKEFNTIVPIGSIEASLKNKTDIQRLKNEDKTLISIVCFSINPNHFHFILKQEEDGGISEFMKRLLGGYTKYFNKIHKRNGALFQGRFKSKLIKDNDYFLKIRPYVNTNYLIHDIPNEKKHLVLSSCQEYDTLNFNIVNKKEAINLLEFYGSNKIFKSECLKVSHMVREERGKKAIDEEDFNLS